MLPLFSLFVLISLVFTLYITLTEIPKKDHKWLTHVTNGDRVDIYQDKLLRIVDYKENFINIVHDNPVDISITPRIVIPS